VLLTAGCSHDRYCGGWVPEAEIEDLSAKLHCGHGGMWASVRYEVEVEDAPPGSVDLVLEFTERGRPLIDRHGEPLAFVIPLDRPRDGDDDEFEYKGRFTEPMPLDHVRRPKHLRVEALLIDRSSQRVLDTEEESLKLSRG
jgi:hypothetical protein